jgi:hypothetical protein
MILNKKVLLKFFIICLISVSFFLGYFLRENAVGGGLEFYAMEWPIIQSLKKDFLFTINNYGLMHDYTMPFPHMLNAYINPFSDNVTNFQLANTIISFLIFIIFAIILKKKKLYIDFIDVFLISSVFLLLPFFRTSAFWGKQENYGWLFLIIAFYFFSEIKKNISKNPNKRDILNIVFFCLTSACALYARQALFFLPISYFLYLFFNNASKKIIVISIISFAIFSIPGFLLMWTWGSVFHAVPGIEPWGGFLGGWINYSHILKNLPIILSFFGFYLLPFLMIELLNSGFKYFFYRYFKSFLFALTILFFLSQTNLLNYLGNYTQGGGSVLKVNYLIQKNNFLLLLVFSSIGFSILVRFIKEDTKNSLIILLPVIIIYTLPKLLHQEYVEPLILIIFFLYLKTDLHKIYLKNISLSHLIFISYFAIYLIGSIYFKHYAFSSYEEWKIFLNAQ